MTLIRWSPFIEPFEDMNKMLDTSNVSHMMQGFTPPVDVYETKDAVVVETPLAGINPNDVEIAIENDTLTIKGEAKKESEVEDKNYYRKEVRSGSFFRSIALPAHVDREAANAQFANGMLRITVPKAPEAKPKTIKVTVVDNDTK